MANNMQLSFLNDLKPHKTAWRIQVKILHSWRFFMKGVGESMELILSDAHGTKIHASCKKTYMADLAKHVRVGAWRNIDHFCVSGAGNGAYRSTGHKYRLAFIHSTKISESTLHDDNMFLNIVDFDSIQSGLLDSNFLIDVFGQVLDLGDLETIQCTGGKQRKKLEFSLVNVCGQRLACCLWGKFAENLHSVCQETEGIVLWLLRFAKIGQYREVQISNAFDASQLFINPEIAEADEFKQRETDESQALAISESEDNKLVLQIKRDKWMQYPQKNIHELFESTQDEILCRIVATIYAIDTDWGWYYFGCQDCNKKVFPHSKIVKKLYGKDVVTHMWYCETCKVKVSSVSPRFKIHLLVKDDTGESSFMLLDSIAIGVVPQSATDLLNGSLDELEDTSSFPDAITTLVGQTFMFGVYIEKDGSSGAGVSYKVGKVWKDLRMLMLGENSESYSVPNQGIEASPLLLEAQGDESVSTPSSKRKGDHQELPELESTSKKQSTKVIKMEKIQDDSSESS
ncbi:PREDICTED: replication protein A 70 kDa DNA-binding subunit B-like [Brassica oleracea var. oleracea]|uniref:replication protein A 70 kDa DNA-binding subunit B-like n=1 Tax=Brassica oleracea var. oleracea TaxID=109376 RepID=UPI0006A72ECC|nr:PREDICTED: replication protein A 70 kDa DNA-binding subunit B-like [Brassica oleracea var. oleracea]